MYDYRAYRPEKWWQYARWLCEGGAYREQTPEDLQDSLLGLARCIWLLRMYLEHYGLPTNDAGGMKDQERVLREVCRYLYSGGTPLWVLESIMQKAAEGLTGHRNVNWLFFPRKALVFFPYHADNSGTTCMFRIQPGFNMSQLHAMERIAVRLASYASNTRGGAWSVPSTFPRVDQFRFALDKHATSSSLLVPPREALARTILSLASSSHGLFFFVNAGDYLGSTANAQIDDFWIVSEEERELFRRLATIDALRRIDEVDTSNRRLYSPPVIIAFRVLASAGACAFWFGGSWIDMLVSGVLAVVIAYIGQSKILSNQEKIIYETVASFIVGTISGMIFLRWPDRTCFVAMALAGVLDILQGFRVVYSVIEVMSKQTVAGGANLLEGILFTGLIAYFLRFGQLAAARIMGDPGQISGYAECTAGISDYWDILLVPLASLSWSGIFNPTYWDLIPMCLHGCLAFGVNYGLTVVGLQDNAKNFVSAAAVSFSAGLLSRFTGRQAVGNTVAGLFALVPGAYLVRSFFSMELSNDFFLSIVQNSVAIGIGAWTGSILCSPTLLGGAAGLLAQQSSQQSDATRRQSSHPVTMLYF